MDSSLAEAFIHGRHSVCGFDLAPFTLRHAFVLEALDSPLSLASAAPVTFSDLFKAVRICAARDESDMQAVILTAADESAAEPFAADSSAHYEAFQIYLKDFITCPRLLERAAGGSYQCHPLLVIATKLIKHGIPTQDAWWTPYGAARWYSLALDDLNPDASFKILDERLQAKLRSFGHKIE